MKLKSLFPAFLVLTLLGGCAVSCPASPPSQPPAETGGAASAELTAADVTAAYEQAAQAYDWFDLTVMPLSDETALLDGRVYHRVDYPGIATLAELEAYLNTLFTPELTQDLFARAPDLYADIGGALCAQDAGRGSNLYLLGKAVSAVQTDDTHWAVTLTFYADSYDLDPADAVIGYSTTELRYEKTNAGWRFAAFCPSDHLDLDADTVFQFIYDWDAFETEEREMENWSDLQLACWLLHADGGFAEGPSELFARRFLADPEGCFSALSAIQGGPWEQKTHVVPMLGYDAAGRPDSDREQFETALNALTPETQAEQETVDAIKTAYHKTLAEREENKVTPEREFTFVIGIKWLTLGPQEGEFPWGFDLEEVSRTSSSADTYGTAHRVDCGNLIIWYFQTDDSEVPYLYAMATTATQPSPIWTRRSVYCGFTESELLEYYTDVLSYSKDYTCSDYTADAGYDGAWIYEPSGESGCKHIAFFMKDGIVSAIEIVDLIDGMLLG